MEIDLLVTKGLGDSSYLLTSGDEAAVVDPQRDVARVIALARSNGATIRYVVETHVHNDYVSGAAELRAATGAQIVGPVGAGYAFEYRAVEDGDEIAIGDATLVALATPGHTFEHTAYVVRERGSGEPTALFSGGSLIVGSAGRTDLLGADRAEELTRLQFATMRRLAALPDRVALLPTHGAGSFCATSPPGERRTSSIGEERLGNPALVAADEPSFAREQLTGLARFPAYYAHMAPINRAGPTVFGDVPVPAARSAGDVAALMAAGAHLVDARDGAAFAAAHVPGSVNVPLEESFGSYVGWLVPFGSPLALVVPEGAALVEACTQLFRIGYERIEGHLAGGLDAWRVARREIASYPTVSVAELVTELARGDAGQVIDVRQRTEWDAGHLDASRHVFVGDVADRLGELDPATRSTVVCASGYRSAMAASLLHRAGLPVRLLAEGGVPRVLRMLARRA
jgi:glyoxylase-like metal-dependent hydrolase (beta-lactamase superfamily II)/rhodanese-related sulfurtransferase